MREAIAQLDPKGETLRERERERESEREGVGKERRRERVRPIKRKAVVALEERER